jgi:hypothetical protein
MLTNFRAPHSQEILYGNRIVKNHLEYDVIFCGRQTRCGLKGPVVL